MTESVDRPRVPQPPNRSGFFNSVRQRLASSVAPDAVQKYPTLYSPVHEVSRTESAVVREDWVDAIIDGNADFPQLDFGIDIYLASTLMNNPPKDWNDLFNADLSQVQVDRIGAEMTRYHRPRGIEVIHEAQTPKPQEKVFSNVDINRLWLSVRTKTYRFIEANLPEIGKMNDVLVNPQNLQLLAQKIASLKDVLTTEQMADLAKAHKQVLNKKVPLSERQGNNSTLGKIAEEAEIGLDSEDSRIPIAEEIRRRMERLVKEVGRENSISVAMLVRPI